MAEEKDLEKKIPDSEEDTSEEVEGYAVCTTSKQRCLYDCKHILTGALSPMLSTAN